MGKAKRLPSGSWRVREFDYTDENKVNHYKSFTADTKAAAELMGKEFKASKLKKRKKAEPITVGKAIDNYITLKEKAMSPTTIRGYKIHRKNYFQSLMDIKIDDLTDYEIQKAIDFEIERGKSPKTISNSFALLSASVKRYTDIFNPKVTLPQKTKKDIHIPTKEEINRIFEEVRDTDMELPFTLSVYLGIRRSEMCALEWEDVDFKNNIISINKAYVISPDNTYQLKPPKTDSSYRKISIPDKAMEVLKKYEKKTGKLTELTPAVITNRFCRLTNRLGIKNFRWHDIRHYTASVMLALNVPNQYAMKIMGHATDNMLKTVYQHTMEDEMKKISDKINNFFDKI